MTRTCPDCGNEVEYAARPATVLQGACEECGRSLTIVQDAPEGVSGGVPAAGSTSPATGAGENATWSGPVPTCAACGAAVTFHAERGGIQGVCVACGTTSVYMPEGTVGAEPRSRRPPRPDDRPREDRGGFGAPRSRPCRECGGPLRFSTAPDGTITGECDSCGNRFTLPPRQEFRGRGRDGDGRGRSFGGPRGPPRFDRRPGSGGYGRPRGGGYRPREGRGEREDDGDPPRRRRPRRE